MPSSTRYSGRQSISASPPLTTPTYSVSTTVGQQKLNVVTRIAVEGCAERGANGASIKIYIKISLPLESVTPGATIPLFPEENLKILDSQVHPMDANSVPYNFSSTTSPLLHKAARALNLPARSLQSYVPLDVSSSPSESLPPLDEKFTGQILVSSYHVAYILPKEFPRRETDTRSKRPSTIAQFMAAIDIWAPFVSQPPNAPFLLSIPVPRCLSNHIKLKIFPPHTPKRTSSSLASLSSADEEVGSWDLTSDPHVTRSSSSRLSRTHSYNNFADDESSDASTSAGFSDGCGIQGSFPSTERIRVRWAKPVKATQVPQTADGRRRVGIKEVKGDMSCTVLGRTKGKSREASEGIVIRVQYEAVCKGIYFPGVATLLGLDVSLDAGDCDVSWVSGAESKWFISGGVGFTGFAVGPPPTPQLSRQSSVENPSIYVLPSSPDARGGMNGLPPARHDSSSSTSSLLRAPLPVQNVPDYSFESSPASTPMSSLASLPLASSPERDRRSRASSMNGPYTDMEADFDDDEAAARPPKVPITIHLNMNDLLPPSRHDLKFAISGTILVKPRTPVLTLGSRRFTSSPNASHPPSDSETDLDVLVVPRFRVLCTDREYVSCTIRNDVGDATLDVYKSSGDVRDAQTRKVVLQWGGLIKCGIDGARIALHPVERSISPPSRDREDSLGSSHMLRSRLRTPNGRSVRDMSPSALRQSLFASAMRTPVRRDGPLMIPYVHTIITPLLGTGSTGPPKYAVRVNLPAPTDDDMEWLEFGLAFPRAEGDAPGGEQPKVEVASASIEGVPVRVITRSAQRPVANGSAVPFGEESGKEWLTWVKVHVRHAGGGKVDVLYLVSGGQTPAQEKSSKGKLKVPDLIVLNTLLPSFSLPVGEIQVNVPDQTGFSVKTDTNLTHEQMSASGRKLSHYSMDEYFHPRLILTFVPAAPDIARTPHRSSQWSWPQITTAFLLLAISILLLIGLRQLQARLAEAVRSANAISTKPVAGFSNSACHEALETITITTTTTVVAPSVSFARWYIPSASPAQAQETHDYPPSAAPADEATPLPPSPPPEIPTPTHHPIPTITPTSVEALSADYALVRYLDFPDWLRGLKLEFRKIEFPKFADAAESALEAVLKTMFQFFWSAYHFPTPPP